MSRNGSGMYSRVSGVPYVYNTVIDQVVVNSEFDDIATALTGSLAKDGQTTPTANLPMGTFRHTGVGAATARTHYARAAEVQDSSLTWCSTAGGTADAFTLSPTVSITAYAAGQSFSFLAVGTNTGAATVNVSGVGAKDVQASGAALSGGEIVSGKLYSIRYDGTQFQLEQVSVSAFIATLLDDASAAAARATLGLPESSAFTFRNKIINGSMQIAQRGVTTTNPTSSNFYTLDRWGANRGSDVSGSTVTQSGDYIAGLGTQYTLRHRRTAADASANSMDLWHTLESKDSYPLAGKTVTLSFYAKKGANYSGGSLYSEIIYGTGTDQRVTSFTGYTVATTGTHTLTTSMQRFTITATLPSNATEVGLHFAWSPSGTAGAADEVHYAAVQLEEGSIATPFEQRSIQQELALCQRYYYRVSGAQRLSQTGLSISTSSFTAVNKFPMTMRVAPSALEQSGTAGDYSIIRGGLATSAALTSVPTFSSATTDWAETSCPYSTATLVNGTAGWLQGGVAGAYLGWSAEL